MSTRYSYTSASDQVSCCRAFDGRSFFALTSTASYKFDAIVPPTTMVSVVHGTRSSLPDHESPSRRRCSRRSIESCSVTSDGSESAASERMVTGMPAGTRRWSSVRAASSARAAASSVSPPRRSSAFSDSPRPRVSKRSFHDGVAACTARTSAARRSGSGSRGVKRSATASAVAMTRYVAILKIAVLNPSVSE